MPGYPQPRPMPTVPNRPNNITYKQQAPPPKQLPPKAGDDAFLKYIQGMHRGDGGGMMEGREPGSNDPGMAGMPDYMVDFLEDMRPQDKKLLYDYLIGDGGGR